MSLGEQFMTMLGATKGSSSTQRVNQQTEGQQELWQSTLDDYKNLEYKSGGEYNSGKGEDELEGFKNTSFDQLRKLKDEGRLSLDGLNKLRNYGATAATQVRPDVEALRNSSDNAWSGYDNQLAETTREARVKLNEADVASRRGAGSTGGTALARLGKVNVENYGRTVGGATARAVEQSAIQRQQLQMQGRMQAGQLSLGASQQGLQGLQGAGQLELGQLGLTAQDLASRRNQDFGERQFSANNEMDRARYGEQQAQSKNLYYQNEANNANQFQLNRLRDQTAAANVRTFEDVKTIKKGNAGLGGALLTAGGAIAGGYLGGPAGASAGASFGGSLSSQWSGGAPDNYSGMVNAGVTAYNSGEGKWGGSGYNQTPTNSAYTQPKGYGANPSGGEFGGTGNYGPGSFNTSASYNPYDDGWSNKNVMNDAPSSYNTSGDRSPWWLQAQEQAYRNHQLKQLQYTG